MKTIGRNDPCECGSGKKYKKCCGNQSAVNIDDLVLGELEILQAQAYDYIAVHKSDELENDYHRYFSEMTMMNKDQEIYEMAFLSWYGVTKKLEEGQSLIEMFVEKQGKAVGRPQTLESLEEWKSPRLAAGIVTSAKGSELVIQDTVEGETFNVEGANPEIVEGCFFIGILLQNGISYLPFAQYFVYPGIAETCKDAMVEKMRKAGRDSVEEYLASDYLYLADHCFDLFTGRGKGVSEETEAVKEEKENIDNPAYAEAIDSMKAFLTEQAESSFSIEKAAKLLTQYFESETPKIRNPQIYSASIVEVIKADTELKKDYLQKDLAEAFGVSANSISRRAKEMKKILLTAV
ncbi:SEC-C metal-binding domain-containing protein [Bacillus sp. P14.5]|uniref:YecA family protein n=1 Tax=Bacillus sp. P14.5 TaxID=1983400 RepID=UPI000DE9B86D|nr:SEC-C metal-binding domain-containing protein [Bacillus sp. P14.5]